MSLRFTIPFIDEALGGSVFYEEYKGDLAEARRAAAAALDEARQGGEPDHLADALLACGVAQLLQGEPLAALRSLDELAQLAADDPPRLLRALSYAYLAIESRFKLLPSGSYGLPAEANLRWDKAAWVQLIQRWHKLNQAMEESATRLESEIVGSLLALVPSGRNTGRRSDSVEPEENASRSQAALAIPQEVMQRAQALDAHPALLAYIAAVQADLHYLGGHPDEARALREEARATYLRAGDAAGAAACLMLWGDRLAAPLSSPAVWNFITEEGTSGSELPWWQERQEFGREGIDSDGARAAYAEAERLFEAACAPRGLAAIQLRYGYLQMLAGDFACAARHAQEAERRFALVGDIYGTWTARAHRALCQIGADDLAEQTELAAAIGQWGATEGSFSYALGLGLFFGRAARRWLVWEGDYERALAAYRLAAALYAALGATRNSALSVRDQGWVYKQLGETHAALTLYEQGLDWYEQALAAQLAQDRSAEDTIRLASLCVNLAYDVNSLYLIQMDPDGLERIDARIRNLIRYLPAGSGTLRGLARNARADSALAIMAWGASSIARNNQEFTQVLIPLYRAEQQKAKGDQVAVERLVAEALAAAHKVRSGQRHFLEAGVHAQQEHYPEAIAAFKRYSAAGGANAGMIGTAKSLLQHLVPGPAAQAELRNQEVRTHEQAFEFMVRCKAYTEARPHLKAIEQLAGPDWWAQDEQPWIALCDCGDLYEGLNDLDAAMRFYGQAITQFEQRRGRLTRDDLKTAFADSTGPQALYLMATRTALKLHEGARQRGDHEQAQVYASTVFQYAEQGRARALLDLIVGSATLARLPRAEGQALYAWRRATTRLTIWRQLLAHAQTEQSPDAGRLADLSLRVESEQAEIDRIEAHLAEANPQIYHAVNPQAALIPLAEVSARLSPGTALLQYAFRRKDLLAWAMTSEGMVHTYRAVIDSRALDRQIDAFHHACEAQMAIGELGAQLTSTLLEPFADVLGANPRLLIVPYGAAHRLPFHALPWQGQPLASTHTISYLPSASALPFLRPPRDALAERMLAVGNPAHMSYQASVGEPRRSAHDLPAAAAEAAFVASLFPAGEALLGEWATEQAVTERIGRYPLLHLATHGYLSEQAPLLSSILLADGQELSVYELMGMQLDADLVVLSACRTAEGETTGGDEVLGLTRGLLAAGARAAIVSLWPVDDLATSLLMGSFYRRLRAGDALAVALQSAQRYLRGLSEAEIAVEYGALKVALQQVGSSGAVSDLVEGELAARNLVPVGAPTRRKDYSHPHYWAPFILVGGDQ